MNKNIINDHFYDFNDHHLDRIALIDNESNEISYNELKSEVNNFAKRLEKDQLIFLVTKNNKETIIAYLACLKIKNPVLLIDHNTDITFLKNLNRIYNPNILIRDLLIEKKHSNKHSYNKKLCLMLSTSGSTGSPKIVCLSEENLLINSSSIISALNINDYDNAITTLPMSYSYGLSIINSHLRAGSTIVLNNQSIISKKFWDIVCKHKVNSLNAVPYTYQMLKKFNIHNFNTKTLDYFTVAGGKLDIDTKKYFVSYAKSNDKKFIVMYGQTEATARMTYLPYDKIGKKIESIGIPVDGGKIKIFDKNGKIVNEPFKQGQINYEGKNVMLGYANTLEDLTQGDMTKGKLNTGDLGYFDNEEYYYITGRISRFIKIYGLRVNLDEIDDWLKKNAFKAISDGNDEKLLIYYENSDKQRSNFLKKFIKIYKIHPDNIKIVEIKCIPYLENGKVDYKSLRSRK